MKCSEVWLTYFEKYRGFNPPGNNQLLNLKTTGPNNKISILGATADAYCFNKSYSHLLSPFTIISKYFNSDLHHRLNDEIWFSSDLEPNKDFKLGKLSTKVEAAGKVRVFAIVDVWTQTLLEPIHKHVFDILKQIPNDGCFDQEKPLRRLLAKGHKEVFSYDLSAATDRFPINLQRQVLSHLYTVEVAQAWVDILINRDFEYFSKDKYWGSQSGSYRYSVGQPMGALSSWGVFSLTHHFVVQYAAFELGWKSWFDDYALLGDDIVIADPQVARHYYYIMTEILGVEINLSKSIQSDRGVMEFAKRLVAPHADYSPVGPKNVALALKAPAHLSTVVLDYLNKGGVVEHAESWLASITHEIVKISRGKLEQLLWTIQGPFGFLNSGSRFGPVRVETTLSKVIYIDKVLKRECDNIVFFSQLGVTLDSIDPVNSAIDKAMIEEVEQALEDARSKTMKTLEHYKNNVFTVPGFKSDSLQDSPAFRSFLISGYENATKLFTNDLSIPRSSGLPTINAIVKFKLSHLPQVFPVDNCLNIKRVQRPRFRSTNMEFFKRVNQYLVPYLSRYEKL
jgi:hypothetical protein